MGLRGGVGPRGHVLEAWEGMLWGMATDVSGDDLAGDLRDAPFPEVLTRVEHARRTGRLTVATGPAVRDLAFVDGSLVAVDGVVLPASGEDDWLADTVLELCALPEGHYAFVDDTSVPAATGVGADEVLHRADRRLAAWREVTTVIPSTLAVPHLASALAPDAQVVLDARDWHVLVAVDGQRTVGDVIVATGRGPFDVCATLARLVHQGAVTVDYPG